VCKATALGLGAAGLMATPQRLLAEAASSFLKPIDMNNFYGAAFFSGDFFSGIIQTIEQTLVKLRSFTERRRF
jgi:hypothetical protein